MTKKGILLTLAFLSLLSLSISNRFIPSGTCEFSHLTSKESEIVSRVNGTNAYNYDLELEKIALNHYAFRSSGSPGANETASWIKEKFTSFGLETYMESFDFTTWDLLGQPVLTIDEDNNASTTEDQKIIESFWSSHYSWPTPENGIFSDLVILPLPKVYSREEAGSVKYYDAAAWLATNTTGKILLMGMEVRRVGLYRVYMNKLMTEPPAAVIFTWWYKWSSFTPPMLASVGGRPADTSGPYYWNLNITVGYVSYEDGLCIRNIAESKNISARISIPAEIGSGPHYNVVGKLKGSVNPEKIIIVSGHYDTVTTCGFCDNGAGTAGVLELAHVFSEAAKEGIYVPQHTILFIAFTGEELGLVGSIHFIKQHKAEMKNIAAVINLDCIGSDVLEVSETCSANGLDLDEVVLKAARDLNVTTSLVEPGGSDQESFQYPKETNNLYKNEFWQLDAGIDDASPVIASTALFSSPLFPSDYWYKGTPGWIHTQYDNSTSTNTLNWVETHDLEAHIRVAALSILRLLSHIYNPFLLQVTIAAVVTSIIAVVVICLERSRAKIFLTGMYNRIYDSFLFIEHRGLVYVILLSFLSLLVFSLGSMHFEKIEIVTNGFPKMVDVAIWGFPLKMGVIIPTESTLSQFEDSAEIQRVPTYVGGGILILWEGVVLDIILYLLSAFATTYSILRLKYEWILRSEQT